MMVSRFANNAHGVERLQIMREQLEGRKIRTNKDEV
jgi:hypothetical protein